MGEVTRYESTLCDGQGHPACTAGLVEQPDGDWVLYDDHRREIERKGAGMTVDLDAVRERHHKMPYGEEAFICEHCHVGDCSEEPYGFWPCDAIQLADEIERLRTENEGLATEVKRWREGESTIKLAFAEDEIERLREAGFDVIERIEAWEAAVRKIIGGREIAHGMDLTQLRAALDTEGGGGG